MRRYEDDRLTVSFAYDALGRRLYKKSHAKYRDRRQAGPVWNENQRRELDEQLGCGFTWYVWEGDTLAFECRDRERHGRSTHYVFEPGTFVPVAQGVVVTHTEKPIPHAVPAMNRCLLLTALLLCAPAPAPAADDWNLAYDREGIRVYLSGAADSSYQQFRGVSTMKASVRTLTDLQENLRVACKWLYACDQMRLLEVEGANTWVYLTTNLPWPTMPRDIVLKVTSERLDDGTLLRRLSAEPDRIPEVDGLIRVQHLSGEWRMKPLGERETEVTYQLQADPAGDVPGWLANRFVVDAPVVTLRTLRAVAERQP